METQNEIVSIGDVHSLLIVAFPTASIETYNNNVLFHNKDTLSLYISIEEIYPHVITITAIDTARQVYNNLTKCFTDYSNVIYIKVNENALSEVASFILEEFNKVKE